MPEFAELQHLVEELAGLLIVGVVLWGLVEALAILIGGASGNQVRRLRWPLVVGFLVTWSTARIRRGARRGGEAAIDHDGDLRDDIDDFTASNRAHVDQVADDRLEQLGDAAGRRDGSLALFEDAEMARRRKQ